MEIPTPISDAARRPHREYGLPDQVNYSVAVELERKLTLVRDLLACINSSQIMDRNIHQKISETLKQTAPL